MKKTTINFVEPIRFLKIHKSSNYVSIFVDAQNTYHFFIKKNNKVFYDGCDKKNEIREDKNV